MPCTLAAFENLSSFVHPIPKSNYYIPETIDTFMEEYSSVSMERRTGKILRRSIFAFLQNYQYFTTISSLLAFPFAASYLLAQAFVPPSPLLALIQARLRSLFDAAGFPVSSEFVTVLIIKLSQTIATSLLVLPFTLSFLLLAKASIFQSLSNRKQVSQPGFTPIVSVYEPLVITQICNLLIVLYANGTCFSILFFVFNSIEALGLSNSNSILILTVSGAVLYSVFLAYSFIICNFTLALSGVEKRGGYIAILKACVMIRGRTRTALSLVLSTNMALASVEALFQYRIVSAYLDARTPNCSMALEGMFITYLYAILLVVATIVDYEFYGCCKTTCEMEQEGKYWYGIQDEEKDAYALGNLKLLNLS